MDTKGQRRKFSADFKEQVVKERLHYGLSMRALSKKHNIDTHTLRDWIKRYIAEGRPGLEPKASTHPNNLVLDLSDESASELERLKYENVKLRMENLFLKKMHAYLRGDAE